MPEIEEQEHDAGANAALPVKNILFGKYELGKLLGCGAFAKVYHARNLQSGQSVAIKAISKQKVLKSGLTSHIKREICIMRRLRHPNIVKLIEVLASKTKIFFVMEFVKGGELFSKVAKGRFSEDLSRRYFQQLISAVEYCHSHGVFHRDLKPENLLLDENGDLKVSDFGLSAITDEQIRNDGLLHTLCGTPAYVAPEILAKQGYDGAKVDIWSCGVILFVMNAGYLPFNDPNLMVMYRKIYKGEFRCPKWMSPDLRRFLSRLLDTNPETRITVDEITRDPWFTKGMVNHYKPPVQYNHINNEEDCFGATFKPENKEDDNPAVTFLNAFDIISFSSGFDLSGLFNGSGSSAGEKRVVSAESPEKIVEKIEEVAKKENVGVQKKDVMMVALVGQKGETLVRIEIHRLTEILVVLEMRFFVEIWREKLDGLFRSLTYQPEAAVPGN